MSAAIFPWIRAGRSLCIVLAVSLLACLPIAAPAGEDGSKPDAPVVKPPVDTKRHEAFLAIAKTGEVDLLFVGDSITDFWRRRGNQVWAKEFAPLKAANFGIGGDTVQGVLWRMQNGELDGIRPKLVVLMIGTNNISMKPEAIAAGIKQIISEIQQRSPGTRILLLGLLPRGPKPDSAGRSTILSVNQIIATYAQPMDPKRVVYLDFGEKFLNEDKTMNKELMPDTLHPNEAGYQIWADAIRAIVTQEMERK